jgi:hypothetical protein
MLEKNFFAEKIAQRWDHFQLLVIRSIYLELRAVPFSQFDIFFSFFSVKKNVHRVSGLAFFGSVFLPSLSSLPSKLKEWYWWSLDFLVFFWMFSTISGKGRPCFKFSSVLLEYCLLS